MKQSPEGKNANRLVAIGKGRVRRVRSKRGGRV